MIDFDYAAPETWHSRILGLQMRAEPHKVGGIVYMQESDAKPCYATDYTHDRCKYSVNRGWAENVAHGTLTAEQVREAVPENFEEMHETRYDHWEPSKFDWQAIADELNAELDGGECEDVSAKNGIFKCSECGCTVEEDGVDWGEIHYCPDCGKAVKR